MVKGSSSGHAPTLLLPARAEPTAKFNHPSPGSQRRGVKQGVDKNSVRGDDKAYGSNKHSSARVMACES